MSILSRALRRDGEEVILDKVGLEEASTGVTITCSEIDYE